MSAGRIGRAFSPENCLGNPTQGVALGWYGTGLWPSEFGSDDAPTAQPHTSLGQRPRIAAPKHSKGQRPALYQRGSTALDWGIAPGHAHGYRMRAEGPTYLTAPCLNRSRIS